MSSSGDTGSQNHYGPPTRSSAGNTITATLSAPFATSTPTAAARAPTRSLARAVYDRRQDYVTKAQVRIKIGSWNVASSNGTDRDLKSWFVEGKAVSTRLAGLSFEEDRDGFSRAEAAESVAHQEQRAKSDDVTVPLGDMPALPGDTDIGLYVLGLQEVVDISSATGALRPYSDPQAARKWREAVAEALPEGYELVAEQQLIGLYLVIFASATVARSVSSVSTHSVGTGLMGYMGNKGAVAVRLVLGDLTKVVFINSHLAAGNEKGSLERRNWDAAQIVQRTKFDPIDHGNGIVDEVGDSLGAEHYAFWFGDLNYRLADLPGEDVRRLLMLHTRNEYDVGRRPEANGDTRRKNESQDSSNRPWTPHGTSSQFVVSEDSEADDAKTDVDRPSSSQESQASSDITRVEPEPEEQLPPDQDPASLQTTLASLLPHDQLHEQIRIRKAFHEGWREGPLRFLPTYKYDVGSVGSFDSSEKRRGPSWCDRILYRTQLDYRHSMERAQEEELAKKRDAEMTARGLDKNADDTVLFDYNPEMDGTAEDATTPYDPDADFAESDAHPEVPDITDESLQLQYYTSHQRVLSSDHKPLDAIFDLTYDTIDVVKKAEVTSAVAKELDRDENEARPTLTLIVDQANQSEDGKGQIDFGQIRFDEPKHCNITIANTGSVTARFGLVNDVSPETHHSWLNVGFGEPAGEDVANKESKAVTEYTFEPGDTMSITCTLHVRSIDDVRLLNYGELSLDDVRILRVQDGRDHFLTSHGNWQRSCFGLSLETLIRVPEGGVRTCGLELGSSLDDTAVRWSAPRELFRLTEGLEESLERSLAEWGMKNEKGSPPWACAGWPFLDSSRSRSESEQSPLRLAIRESLDTGQPFTFEIETSSIAKVEAFAFTLLFFLDNIDSGIVSPEIWAAISTSMNEHEKTMHRPPQTEPEVLRALVLDALSVSSPRSVAFTFVTFMLARLMNEIAPVPADAPLDTTADAATSSSPAAKAAEKAADLLKGKLTRRSTGTGIGSGSGGAGAEGQKALAHRKEGEKRVAEVFASVLFPVAAPDTKGKERRADDEKRRAVMAAFLHGRGNDP